jgi:site-specific recombinase XerD
MTHFQSITDDVGHRQGLSYPADKICYLHVMDKALAAAVGLPPPVKVEPERIEGFYASIPRILEAWIQRRSSPHTQRAYRQDLLGFVHWLGIPWPERAVQLLAVSILDVQAYRQALLEKGAAPKTLNRRISSLSSFYKYVAGCAAELRLPVTLPNPAHAQFIARATSDPVEETRALPAVLARQLMDLPTGDTVEAARDRALLRVFLYAGVRLGTACRLRVEDFHWDGIEATLRLREKGDRHRTIGLHHAAALAVREYLDKAGLEHGPLFRPLHSARRRTVADRPMSLVTMYGLVRRYLEKLPGALRVIASPPQVQCLYSPHSLRATTATLLLNAGVDITKVQALLGHRHITTTQIYDKRRHAISDSASHQVPL